MSDDDPLVARWRSPEGQAIATDTAFRLIGGESFAGSKLELHEGRWDLRGFRLPPPSVVGRFSSGRISGSILDGALEVSGATWVNLDLTNAVLPSLRFFDSTINNCRLDGAMCSDWRLWRSTVVQSSFAKTSLRDSVIGTWYEGRGNVWRQVDFRGADLRGASMDGSLFEECDFSRARMGAIQFVRSRLIRVTFSGRLKDVLFDCRHFDDEPEPETGPLIEVDFSNAIFDSVEFRGCYFQNVRFPPDPGLRLIPNFPSVAKRQLEILEGDPSSEASGLRAILDIKLPGAPDSVGVFSRAELLSWRGESFAALGEKTLTQALADLGISEPKI